VLRNARPLPSAKPRPRRQKSAAAPAQAEETATDVKLTRSPGLDKTGSTPLYDMYSKRELYDVVGDQSLVYHRMIMAMISKMWRAEFGRNGRW
jgi:hypothetical protein